MVSKGPFNSNMLLFCVEEAGPSSILNLVLWSAPRNKLATIKVRIVKVVPIREESRQYLWLQKSTIA